jgi:zinc protease
MNAQFPKPLSTGTIPVYVETSKAIPLVHVTVALRRGAAFDPDGCAGLTRLTTRLMRRTAGGVPLTELEKQLDRMGASLGADASYSNVSLQSAVLSRSIGPCIDIMSDALCRPGLADEEFLRLKRETLAELTEGQDNDRGLASRAMRRALFEAHAYGRSVGGTKASINRLQPDDARSRFRNLIQRDDLTIGFSGDIEEDVALRYAQQLAGTVPQSTSNPDDIAEPTQLSGKRLIFVDKPDRSQTQIFIGMLGSHPKDEDHLDLHVANTVFGGMFSSRLMQQVRVKRGWSYGAYSSLPLDRHRQAFSMWTFPKSEDASACIKLQLDMLAEWIDKGVTARELKRAKNMLIRSYAFMVDTASKRLGLSLDEVLYDLPAGYYASYPKRLSEIRLDSVNAALRRRLNPEHWVVAVVGTKDRVLSDIQAVVPQAQTDIVPFDSLEL